jgi:uncharacterized protein YuzE
MTEFEKLRDKSVQAALDILFACGLEMTYDPERRSVYVNYQTWNSCYHRDIVFCTKEVDSSIFIDFDHDEKILGVEILLPKEE